MSRIDACFAALAAKKQAAFIPFIMAGDPSMEAAQALLNGLPEAGADIIEIGIPFSDPVADGPVIQAAGLRALAAGATLAKTIAMVANFRKTNSTTPIILMGYYNPIYHYGLSAFAKDAAAAGVDGLIIVDLPPEEEGEVLPDFRKHGLQIVRLIAPPSLENRLPALLKDASGYVYYISITGITGGKTADIGELQSQVAALKAHTKLPIAIGFGVKTPEQAASFAALGDAVVVGSSIVKTVEENASQPIETLCKLVIDQVRALAEATHNVKR